MSAPDTNTKKEARRHKFPLVGMAWTIVWAAVLLVALIVYLAFRGNEPGNETPIDEENSAAAAPATTDDGDAATGN